MLMVIFGAGASYDSVSTYPPGTPVQPHGGDLPNRFHRPPLANELFENRPLFAEIIQLFSACEPIIPRLRAHQGETVEAALQELQEKADGYSRGLSQLAAVRYYLAHAIAGTTERWGNVTRGVTNYKTLLDQIERAHRHDDPVCLVTFNYDTMLEDALWDFEHKIAALEHYVSGHRFYRVFKPHGSTNWVRLVDRPVIDKHPQAVEFTRAELIRRAPELKLSTQFRRANLQNISHLEGKPVFPAIAIPVDKKSTFECPQEHLGELVALLPKVTKLLLIGWRATEAHFLALLKTHLTSGVQLYSVAESENAAAGTNRALQNAVPGVFTTAVADPGTGNFTFGFTDFVLSKRPESFLKS
jgi:SIR2-like domain